MIFILFSTKKKKIQLLFNHKCILLGFIKSNLPMSLLNQKSNKERIINKNTKSHKSDHSLSLSLYLIISPPIPHQIFDITNSQSKIYLYKKTRESRRTRSRNRASTCVVGGYYCFCSQLGCLSNQKMNLNHTCLCQNQCQFH